MAILTRTIWHGFELYEYILVTFAVPPRINGSRVTEKRSVVIGGSLVLYCPASGVPEPDIQWTRQREEILFVSEPNVRVVDGGHELQLYNAHLLDAGSYTCTAANPAGNVSKQFVVDVIGEFISSVPYSVCV